MPMNMHFYTVFTYVLYDILPLAYSLLLSYWVIREIFFEVP